MGCCNSTEKPTVYEVTLDNDGIAHHVAEGQGTHFIHVSENNETILEKKENSDQDKHIESMPNPAIPAPPQYPSCQRIHPMDANEKP